jgi:hypothetical protein
MESGDDTVIICIPSKCTFQVEKRIWTRQCTLDVCAPVIKQKEVAHKDAPDRPVVRTTIKDLGDLVRSLWLREMVRREDFWETAGGQVLGKTGGETGVEDLGLNGV